MDLTISGAYRRCCEEIDRCDILVQPASKDIIDSRYATPQKAFGYMVRGKPIAAGDVPCHRSLFEDGKNAVLYQSSPINLAQAIIRVAEDDCLAENIACNGVG